MEVLEDEAYISFKEMQEKDYQKQEAELLSLLGQKKAQMIKTEAKISEIIPNSFAILIVQCLVQSIPQRVRLVADRSRHRDAQLNIKWSTGNHGGKRKD